MTASDTAPTTEIVARAGTYYRRTRYIIVALMIGFGAYFLYDGYVGWPRENTRAHQLDEQLDAARKAQDTAAIARLTEERNQLKIHTPADILLQKILGYSLPPLGVLLLGMWLYRSRGEYRLKDGVLYSPGHPPVPMGAFKSIDSREWQRKGIAHAAYELPNHQTGRIKLDDFVYQQKPIQAIYAQLQGHLDAKTPAA